MANNQNPETEIPKTAPTPLDKINERFSRGGKNESNEIPHLDLSPEDKIALKELQVLCKREKDRDAFQQLIDEYEAHASQLNNDQRNELEQYKNQRNAIVPLSIEEIQRKNDLDRLVGAKVERYISQSKQELAAAPSESAFKGFQSIKEELNKPENEEEAELEQPTQRRYSDIALEEIQLLVHRLFGKNHELRTFFEESMILEYDNEASQQAREQAGNSRQSELGGATVKKQNVDGKEKFVVTVTDETFISFKQWTDNTGRSHSYPEFHFRDAAFTIGKAILTAAVGNEAVDKLSNEIEDKSAPLWWGDRIVEKNAGPQAGSAKQLTSRERAIEYLAFYLIDPEQMAKIDPGFASAAGLALGNIDPKNSLSLGLGETLRIAQSKLNTDYLYNDFDPAKRRKHDWYDIPSEWLANTQSGLGARSAMGGALGYGAAVAMAGSGGLAGVAAIGGILLGKALPKPIGFIRNLIGVYKNEVDFYRELAVSELDNKEVARISAREEGGGDRAKRLKGYIETRNEEGARYMLMSIASSGDFNLWHEYLYLYNFDPLFKATGGKEITQQGYNLVTKLHRFSNKAKRIGTVIGIYEHRIDPYQRHRFVLKSYDKYEGAVWNQWETRGEREAQQVAAEAFDMMSDGNGYIDLDNKYGAGINEDENSRGWQVAGVNDLRAVIGGENAKEFLNFLGKGWKGDERFLNKFNAVEITAIQRMRQFDKKKFPGEHTKMVARDAFEHYGTLVKERSEKLEKRDEEAKKKIEKRSAEELVDNDDIDENELARIDDQLGKPSYKTAFAGDSEYKFKPKHLTLFGALGNELRHVEEDLGNLKISSGYDGLKFELHRLSRYVRKELSGEVKFSDSEDKKEYADILEHIDIILNDANTPPDVTFNTKVWLSKLDQISPRIRIIDQFKFDLDRKVKPFETALETNQGSEYFSDTKKNLTSLRAIVNTAKSPRPRSGLSDLQVRACELLEELERVSHGKLAPESNSIDAINATSSTEVLATTLGAIVKDLEEEQKKLETNVKTEQDRTAELLADARQALTIQKEGVDLPPSHKEVERQERLIRFRKLDSIPSELKNQDMSDHEMYRNLKLAYVALHRRATREKDKQEKDDEFDATITVAKAA